MEESQRISGGVFPRGWSEGPSELRTECLIEGLESQVEVAVSFLQPVERAVLDANGDPVADLIVAGTRYATREEAIEHAVTLSTLPNRTAELETTGCKAAELVENGVPVGTLAWSWEPLHATIEAWIEELASGLRHLRVDIANRLEWDGDTTERTWLRSFHSIEVVVRSADGAILPGRLTPAASRTPPSPGL
jgi:hypothetical protein